MYYLKNFSLFSLHYSIILRNLLRISFVFLLCLFLAFSQSVCFLKFSTSYISILYELFSSLPYFSSIYFSMCLLSNSKLHIAVSDFVIICSIYKRIISQIFLIFLALLFYNLKHLGSCIPINKPIIYYEL